MIRARPGDWPLRYRLIVLIPLLAVSFGGDGRADVINFTGNVANDFPTSPGTVVIPGQPGSVAESSYIIQNGWTSGFLVESIRLSYNKASDTLYVGVQTFSITGDADGNGNPGSTTPQMAAAGGVNYPHFGGDKSLSLGFANVSPTGGMGDPVFVAGIPADKSVGDTRNTNEFTVATYSDTGRGLPYSYGTILNNHVGALAVDPSASQPNFEFALTNFSKIPGFNPSQGFYLSLFLGSQRAIVVGKESINWTLVSASSPAPGGITASGGPISPPVPAHSLGPQVPEPSSVVLFAVGAAGLLFTKARRRARPSVDPLRA
jgi:PEP-CTERM motif